MHHASIPCILSCLQNPHHLHREPLTYFRNRRRMPEQEILVKVSMRQPKDSKALQENSRLWQRRPGLGFGVSTPITLYLARFFFVGDVLKESTETLAKPETWHRCGFEPLLVLQRLSDGFVPCHAYFISRGSQPLCQDREE